MANYQTHVTYGAASGAGVGLLTLIFAPGAGIDLILLGGFFGFIGGMVPDLDHDTGHALRKIASLLATFLPVMILAAISPKQGSAASIGLVLLLPAHYLLHWAGRQLPLFQKTHPVWDTVLSMAIALICHVLMLLVIPQIGLWGFLPSLLTMVCIALGLLLVIPLFKKVTVHRGVFHSVPVPFIYAAFVYLLFASDSNFPFLSRLGIAITAFAGALSHLILDEIYSVDFTGKKMRLKRSFGTALSFWKKRAPKSSFFAYGLAVTLLLLCFMTT